MPNITVKTFDMPLSRGQLVDDVSVQTHNNNTHGVGRIRISSIIGRKCISVGGLLESTLRALFCRPMCRGEVVFPVQEEGDGSCTYARVLNAFEEENLHGGETTCRLLVYTLVGLEAIRRARKMFLSLGRGRAQTVIERLTPLTFRNRCAATICIMLLSMVCSPHTICSSTPGTYEHISSCETLLYAVSRGMCAVHAAGRAVILDSKAN